MFRIDAQLLAHHGRGERDIAAIQEGDRDTDENHHHHDIAMTGGLFGKRSYLCHLTTPQKSRHHAARPAGASDGLPPRRAPLPLH